MSAESDEAKLKKLFRELKESDERRAPSFAHTWQAAAPRATRPSHAMRWLVPLATTVVAVVTIAFVALFHARTRETAPAQTASLDLSQWQSPTASLLNTTDHSLLTDMPSLDQSWMNEMTYLNQNTE